MSDSILISVKKVLGLDSEYTAFDQDVIMHTNSALAILSQLGIGSDKGYQITDETGTWQDITEGNLLLNTVKSYVYLRVRMLFDPPTTSFLAKAMEDQLRELEWRISVQRESTDWESPNPENYYLQLSSNFIIDGGRP